MLAEIGAFARDVGFDEFEHLHHTATGGIPILGLIHDDLENRQIRIIFTFGEKGFGGFVPIGVDQSAILTDIGRTADRDIDFPRVIFIGQTNMAVFFDLIGLAGIQSREK